MNLPPEIERYLHERIVASRRPFCMRVAADHRLVARWGEASAYGLERLRPGDDVSAAVPFLDAQCTDIVELPFISDAQGHAFHAHLIPSAGDCYVLYVDARRELEQKRRAQQTANEVKLLLERERRMIAELVDAKAELTVRRKEAEAESRRRGEYIATMSHEFKTPLTALLAHADQLGQAVTSDLGRQSSAAIRRIVQQQIWLIDNLLTSARLEADGFPIHAQLTDVRALVDDLCIVFAPLAAAGELSFGAYVTDAVPEFVHADALHLRQVLVNLLGNAVKFTVEGGVRLELDYADGKLIAAISDTGPGIPASEQETLFEPFRRGGGPPRASGAGLGLGITRALVDAMHGSLQLESAVGEGTRVTVRIAAAQLERSTERQLEAGAVSILIGDDDADIAELLALRLGEEGFRVRVAADGRAVVEAALADPPDLIVLDTNMPELDGPAAARALRTRGFAAPILALSAAGRRQDIEFALASGCTEFLRKPAHPDTLKRVIRQLLLDSIDPHTSSRN